MQRRLYIDEAHTVLDILCFAIFLLNISITWFKNGNMVQNKMTTSFATSPPKCIDQPRLKLNTDH